MWKDFFYFSRSQQIGIIFILCLIALAIAGNYVLPYFFKNDSLSDNNFHAEVREFKRNIALLDSIAEAQRREQYRQYRPDYGEFYAKSRNAASYRLFIFDPNTADSADFTALGIQPFVAANIVKFRKNGGVFRTVESFSRIYNLTAEKFAELKPYININPPSERKDTVRQPSENPYSAVALTVELNVADSAELMQVNGIGRSYALSIIRFRRNAGGFYSIEQLREIPRMTDENYLKISSQCTVNTTLIKRITVNTASVERLQAHPYINFYQAKAIYELRRRKIKLASIDELRHLKEFSPEQIAAVEHYLSFE